MIYNTHDILKDIKKNLWQLNYDNLYIKISNRYSIRITKAKNEIWFELDQEPLMDGCYIYSSNNLKDVFDFIYSNIDNKILYY